MYRFSRVFNLNAVNKLIRLYSLARRSHYEILNVRKNCSSKEIKEAFIQMSKKYHPDRNKDVKAKEHFVKILEAYNVLSKPSSRAMYDNMSNIYTNSGPEPYVYKPSKYQYKHSPRNTNSNFSYNYSFYENRDKPPQDLKYQKWYYGIAGIKKLPNITIIVLCCGFAFVGFVLQMFIIKEAVTTQRRAALEKSKQISEELERVRAAARANGNELQTRLLLEKIVTAANPTVATASLGQALANEKKETLDAILTEFGLPEVAGITDHYWQFSTKIGPQKFDGF